MREILSENTPHYPFPLTYAYMKFACVLKFPEIDPGALGLQFSVYTTLPLRICC